jgi:hypothetical protein
LTEVELNGVSAEEHHWSYEAETGPGHWGDMDAANKVCSVGCMTAIHDAPRVIWCPAGNDQRTFRRATSIDRQQV